VLFVPGVDDFDTAGHVKLDALGKDMCTEPDTKRFSDMGVGHDILPDAQTVADEHFMVIRAQATCFNEFACEAFPASHVDMDDLTVFQNLIAWA